MSPERLGRAIDDPSRVGAVLVQVAENGTQSYSDGTPSLRLYFSYVTLTTVGYGDYSPAGDLGHTLAVFEALVGQLYLVTVVAVIVGRLHQGRPERS